MIRFVLLAALAVAAAGAHAQERVAVFTAAGPGSPDPALIADIDAAVRRGLIVSLPPDDFTTLMAAAAAPGCTGRCAVARAAEYGATLALAVRVDVRRAPFALDLTVYEAPRGAVRAHRRAEAASIAVLEDLALTAAEQLAEALAGRAPARADAPIVDRDAERHAAARRQAAMRAAAGANSVGITMILVEPGRPFVTPPAGQAYAQARALPDPPQAYLLGATEVTQAQWRAVMGDDPSAFADERRPVERVSWIDAVSFCNRLSEAEGLEPAYAVDGCSARWLTDADGYRLPTDAEWEYACRAGSLTMFSAGAGRDDLADVAWYEANAGKKSQRVARREANAWGFHDMHGNVWEWVWDLYASLPDFSQDNVESPGCGPDRTIRGGSWYTPAIACRTTNFCRIDPEFRCCDLGFRVARTP